MAEEQTLQDSKTLECAKSEVISPMDENPLPKTLDFENPSPKFGNSDEISSGSIDEVSVMKENPCKAIVVFRDTLMDFSKSSDDIVAHVIKDVDIGENMGNVGFETSLLDSCKPGETMQLGNPVSACCETARSLPGSSTMDDVQIAKSLEGMSETMLLGNPETTLLETPVSDCHDKSGIVVRSSEIDDAYVTKTVEETAQVAKSLKEFIQDGVTIAEDVQLDNALKECNEEKEGEVQDCNKEVGGKLVDVQVAECPGLYDDYEDELDDRLRNFGCCYGGCSHYEKDSKFGGTVGSARVQFPERCDYPCCLDCDRLPQHCGRYGGSAGEDGCENYWSMMENHRNPSGYPPIHPYFRELMSAYNRYSDPVLGYGVDPRCRQEHSLRMGTDQECRMYHGYRNRFRTTKEDAELSLVYDSCIMDRGYRFMEREHGRNRNHSWEWPEPEPNPVGAGLSNLGNTCFLNAIIQCFTHTAPFVEGLFLLKHKASSHGQNEFCVLCAVRHQIERSLAFSGKTISPSNLVDNLSHISSDFRRYQQEDAHEFLLCLLDKLDSNWSKHEANAGELSSSHDSLVKQVFGGGLISQLRCLHCGHNSNSYEILNHLSLEIEHVDDLENAFSSFTKVENLQDTDKFMCSGCKEMALGEKQLLIDQAPPVVAVHLKRFKIDGFCVEKIDRIVKYPLEFDLDPYTKRTRNDDEVVKYALYGFVVHVGLSPISGHYFCYIRTLPDTWYRFDDLEVTKVSESTALSQEAYILFYARKGTPWFGDLLEKWKARLEENANASIEENANASFKENANASPDSVLVTTNLLSNSIPLGFTPAGSYGSDETDPTSVISAEPLNFLKPDEVDKESSIANANGVFSKGKPIYDDVSAKEELDTQVSGETTENCCNDSLSGLNYGEDNHEFKTERTELETCSSNLETAFIGGPDSDDMDANPCISPPRISKIYADVKEEQDAGQVTSQVPDHLEVQGKASLSIKERLGKAKRDLGRKVATKCVGRHQILMLPSRPRKKKRKQSSLIHKHCRKKRFKRSSSLSSRTVAATG